MSACQRHHEKSSPVNAYILLTDRCRITKHHPLSPAWLVFVAELCCLWLVQMKDEQLRLEEDEATMKKRLKETREDHKKWEESREGRVWPSTIQVQPKACALMLVLLRSAWLLHSGKHPSLRHI